MGPRRTLSLQSCLALLANTVLPCLAQFAAPADMFAAIQERLSDPDLTAALLSWRRDLHSNPELSWREVATATRLRHELAAMGVPTHTLKGAEPGFVAVIGTECAGDPIVALRADMDALPLVEQTSLPFAAPTEAGAMHACGHDSHMAMLLGAARILKDLEGRLPGAVRLIFQPAEEGGGGGQAVVKAGVLDGVSAVFALHVDPALPTGTVRTRTGPIFASSNRFNASIIGVGGHGAAPHLTRDPVVAAAAAVIALQPLVSRETDPLSGAVVTVGSIASSGGGAPNVIPDSVSLAGTVRAFDPEDAERLRRRVTEVLQGAAVLHGCTADVGWSAVPYPPVVNDAGAVDTAMAAGAAVLGYDAVGELERPYAYAEDFAFMAAKVPGALLLLGVRNESVGAVYGLHHPQFTVDEGALPRGAALHAAVVVEALARAAAAQDVAAAREEL